VNNNLNFFVKLFVGAMPEMVEREPGLCVILARLDYIMGLLNYGSGKNTICCSFRTL
jgi:hypothetical protein